MKVTSPDTPHEYEYPLSWWRAAKSLCGWCDRREDDPIHTGD